MARKKRTLGTLIDDCEFEFMDKHITLRSWTDIRDRIKEAYKLGYQTAIQDLVKGTLKDA